MAITTDYQYGFVTGFEHGTISTAGGGLFLGVQGDSTTRWITSDPAEVRSGSYALKVSPKSTLDGLVWQIHDVKPNKSITRFACRISSFPTDVTDIASGYPSANTTPALVTVSQNGTLGLRFGTGTIPDEQKATGPQIALNTWFIVEVKVDVSAATWRGYWRVNGVAQPDIQRAGSADTWNDWALGSDFNVPYVATFDDWIFGRWDAAGDWYGDGRVEKLSPNGDFSYVNESSFTRSPSGGSYASALDDVPITAGTDYVAQSTTDTNASILMVSEDTTGTAFNAVQAIVRYNASDNLTNHGQTIVEHSGGSFVTTVYNGNMGTTTDTYKSQVVLPPDTGWTVTAVNAIRWRIGWSNDASPWPRWHVLMLEVDIPIETVAKSAADTATLAITDTSTSALRSTATDTATSGLTDTAAISSDTAFIAASDSPTVAVTDTSSLLQIDVLTASDTTSVAITDTSQIKAKNGVADSSALSLIEARTSKLRSAITDAPTIGLTDIRAQAVAVRSSVTDAPAVTTDDVSVSLIRLSRPDSAGVRLEDRSRVKAAFTAADTASLGLIDEVIRADKIFIAASDTTALALTDFQTLMVRVLVAETPTLALTDAVLPVKLLWTVTDTSVIAFSDSTASTLRSVSNDYNRLALAESTQNKLTSGRTDTISLGVIDVSRNKLRVALLDTAALGLTEVQTTRARIAVVENFLLTFAEGQVSRVSSLREVALRVGVEETRSSKSRLSVSDIPSIGATDIRRTGSKSSISDVPSIALSELSALLYKIYKSAADSSTLSITEAASLELQRKITDVLSLGLVDVASSARTFAQFDFVVFGFTDARTLKSRLTVVDVLTLRVLDTSSSIFPGAFGIKKYIHPVPLGQMALTKWE